MKRVVVPSGSLMVSKEVAVFEFFGLDVPQLQQTPFLCPIAA